MLRLSIFRYGAQKFKASIIPALILAAALIAGLVSPLSADSLLNGPSSDTGPWLTASGAYWGGGQAANIDSGDPSASQTYYNYHFNLAGNSISQVRVRYDARCNETSLTLTERPAGDGIYSGPWFPASNRYTVVDESSNPDSDYLKLNSATGGYCLFTYPAFNIPDGSVISSVKLCYRARDKNNSSSNNMRGDILINGSHYYGANVNPTNIFSAYQDTWTSNPVSGLPWSVDDLASIQQFGVDSADADPEIRVSQCYLEVKYTDFEQIRIAVSWDGGTTWSDWQTTTLSATLTAYWYDVTSVVDWNDTKLSNTNFRVKAEALSIGGASRVYLDWIPVEVNSQIDDMAPVVTITAPLNGAVYQPASVPAAGFNVDDPTAIVVENGYSTEVGEHTYTVTATDPAGNVGSDSITYTVAVPSDPVPEVPAGILLAVGLCGVGGFLYIRQRRGHTAK